MGKPKPIHQSLLRSTEYMPELSVVMLPSATVVAIASVKLECLKSAENRGWFFQDDIASEAFRLRTDIWLLEMCIMKVNECKCTSVYSRTSASWYETVLDQAEVIND